jgi:hypothetical protein
MKQLFMKKRTQTLEVDQPLPSLAACVLMDVIGFASFGLPVIGEFLDVLWAPISAMIYLKMFGVRKGFFGGMFAFAEELLPFTDFIPTFTITWMLRYSKRKKASYSMKPVIR